MTTHRGRVPDVVATPAACAHEHSTVPGRKRSISATIVESVERVTVAAWDRQHITHACHVHRLCRVSDLSRPVRPHHHSTGVRTTIVMHRLATRIRARRCFWLPDIAHWCALDACKATKLDSGVFVSRSTRPPAAGHRDGQAASLRVALRVRNASVRRVSSSGSMLRVTENRFAT